VAKDEDEWIEITPGIFSGGLFRKTKKNN